MNWRERRNYKIAISYEFSNFRLFDKEKVQINQQKS